MKVRAQIKTPKTHKHVYYLKCESFSLGKYYRQCECGKKAKLTKYKMSI